MNRAKPKIERVHAALARKEPDRVPIAELFWANFLRRCKEELPVGADFDPYRYWDLDMVVIPPNMDPHVSGIQVLLDIPSRKVVKTGFGATIEHRCDYPMPHFCEFDTITYEDMEAFTFDDPLDPRRYYEPIDDLINAVVDEITLGKPAFVDRVNAYADDFCVFGGVCEPHEMIWRMMGVENVLIKIAEEPLKVARFLERLGDFLVGIVQGQIAAAGGKLSGLYVWGDIAYTRAMFFSPDYWRMAYLPQLRRICDAVHAAGLPVIYHGCGNASEVFEDMIEAGVDAYNPLEAKTGLDVLELKRRFGDRWAFVGNIDVRVLARNNRDEVRREVLIKLNAAKGGGYIVHSDHSVPDNVAPATYDYLVSLVKEYGEYPLELGEYDRT
ncbi:hypothetical protein HS125_15585 [bacterium]|nr:hypothetical protein [bacterium]